MNTPRQYLIYIPDFENRTDLSQYENNKTTVTTIVGVENFRAQYNPDYFWEPDYIITATEEELTAIKLSIPNSRFEVYVPRL